MKVFTIKPTGWACTLQECPPGHFIPMEYPEMLCFKSEYGEREDKPEAFNCAGEYGSFEGLVYPVEMVVEDQ